MKNTVTALMLYSYSGISDVHLVTGFEYSYTKVGAPWHKNEDHLWIKEGINLISDFGTSVYTQDPTLKGRPKESNSMSIGSGIEMNTYSHLLEMSYPLSKINEITYSHRLDNSDLSDLMYSPRLSLISKINDEHSVIVTAQRALRMMPLRAQYLYYEFNQDSNDSEYESLDGVEISYLNQSIKHTSINLRAFYNDITAVGFTGQDLQFLSDFSLMGLDLELNYKCIFRLN